MEGVGVRPDREEGGLVPVLGGLVQGHRDGGGPLHSPHRSPAGGSGAPGRVPGVRERAARDPEPGRRQRVGCGDAGPAHPDGPAVRRYVPGSFVLEAEPGEPRDEHDCGVAGVALDVRERAPRAGFLL